MIKSILDTVLAIAKEGSVKLIVAVSAIASITWLAYSDKLSPLAGICVLFVCAMYMIFKHLELINKPKE